MKKVHILGNYNACLRRHYHPLRTFQKELRDEGIDIDFFSSPEHREIAECDVLMLFEQSHRDILPISKKDDRHAVTDYYEKFFTRFDRVIWFDDQDCSGRLRSYYFPLVDKYLKAQHLIDMSYYTKDHLIGSLNRDFAHEMYGVSDKNYFKAPISEDETNKIDVGWSLAMLNWPSFTSENRFLREVRAHWNPNYMIRMTKPELAKRTLISLRGSLWENLPTVCWWRKNTFDRVNSLLAAQSQYQSSPSGRVNKREYYDELRRSLVTPSPFGNGEICYRDFECFFSGSLLFKANMDHLVTWPNLFVDGVTYISHKWDFSDFDEKFEDILSHPGKYEDVAKEGQRRFAEALSDGKGFVSHFVSMIGEG